MRRWPQGRNRTRRLRLTGMFRARPTDQLPEGIGVRQEGNGSRRFPSSNGLCQCRRRGSTLRAGNCSFTVSNCCFNTVKSTVMPWSLHMRCWALRGRSEQLPTKYPSALNCLTKSRVIAPGGAPTSRVPSMSKLIKVAAGTASQACRSKSADEGQAGCHNEWLHSLAFRLFILRGGTGAVRSRHPRRERPPRPVCRWPRFLPFPAPCFRQPG